PPTADEFVHAANRTRSELGISPEAWCDACTALTPAWASLALVVVASRDDVGEIHTSAGGYFRKLTERTCKETRSLARSLWGAVERTEELYVARVTAPTDEEHSVPGPDSHPRIASGRFDRQRADQATMTEILRATADPRRLALAWRDLVARYRCWPYVDEVEAHYAKFTGSAPGPGNPAALRTDADTAASAHDIPTHRTASSSRPDRPKGQLT
ncbi:MAG: replication initiation protein RepC, partial [Rhodospirillaceae bacterium]|nr:replication initiation protein RepC [Rhodospirillaceae bacterium]